MTPGPEHSEDCVSWERGWEVISRLDGDGARRVTQALEDVAPGLSHLMVAYGFGASYSRPQLAPRDRQLVTLGILAALGADRQIPLHVSAALRAGLTREEIVEALTHSAVYCGFPRAINAVLAARDALADGSAHPSPPGTPGGQ
ncbi:carboxymuconolactone decarboxylase family protein [Streptomyces sp. DSM 44917]|uniref:Carboxymuconolactone decarboxylase family protein n=1 Tax=Streptomyces boetiae TaxID=3075541 RepID=A0ABU2L6Z3_9ACTN|nr:carboxymuconolactone decarboxylase family protein [Streptomyces sp. DSM 44917]MDT0307336.1 carboxymuconolactone decarboxylase family protein [Streptomyces sp. DSM 44917]